ncbi:MAG TPA: hypothetical protein VMC09_11140 [Anaerolineales bacterium]|nr:hypothetical protein [Anaerolineales bacterium]
MTLPGILFGIVLSTLYGTAFHFWKGGPINRLILFILLAWLGFWTGHIVGAVLHWSFANIGPINGGMATLGSAAFLFVGEWLGRVEVTHK